MNGPIVIEWPLILNSAGGNFTNQLTILTKILILIKVICLFFQVKNEVSQVVDMMREYLSQTGAMKDNYCDLLNSFSERLQLHR